MYSIFSSKIKKNYFGSKPKQLHPSWKNDPNATRFIENLVPMRKLLCSNCFSKQEKFKKK